ncbi:hypothetical protein EG327_011474 [Venturia inaequalis]|uniref:M protein, serotype 2.1 n=1 Tax=Venturia inaequalis TaxID=5025 RepID=A0A8H3ZFQ7_VENIN|nr:hypothetical protein EG327_011474 [Venturia inaequalis]
MTANVRKPPVTGPPDRMSPASTPATPPGVTSRNSARPTTPSSPAAVTNGVARNRSVRTANGTPISARSAVKKPAGSSNLGTSTSAADTDARIESSALIEELRERLEKVEQSSEEYRKNADVLQSRLDDALKEQGKLEDKLHEEEERIEGLENDKKEALRQRRELEAIYEADRVASMKEKESTQVREEELQGIIQRLKESLSQRQSRPLSMVVGASSPTLDTGHFAPPSSLQRSNSKSNSKLILQKDQLIESLRLEVAELQIKMMELENMGDASRRVQELERSLLDTRMTNARLMEDIDSYQLLLGEKTLNGDLSRNDIFRSASSMDVQRTPPRSKPSTSLADELSSAAEEAEELVPEQQDQNRRLQTEISALKDQNKALTLYVNKIIERILQHQGGYENILSNHDEDDAHVGEGAVAAGINRPMPPPPNKDKDLPPPPTKDNGAQGLSLLQRAKSVAYGTGAAKPKGRPVSYAPTSDPNHRERSRTENIDTAPSIPLQRSVSKRMTIDMATRRRTMASPGSSEWNASAAAQVVGNMYRGPSGEHGPTSPGITSPRNSLNYFRMPSGGAMTVSSIAEDAADSDSASGSGSGGADGVDEAERARRSALDALNGTQDFPHVDTPSPPRSMGSRERDIGAAVMTGNKMRPLRLVKEAEETNKANRTSWFPSSVTGFFNKDAAAGANAGGGS